MKIENNVLVKVNDVDIIDGVFENHDVTEIGEDCFKNLPNLKKVVLPKVVKINNHCFNYNDYLTSIDLPLLQTVERHCFRENKSLTFIHIPLLETAGNDCFKYNPSLTKLDLPLLKTAGDYCFRENKSLTSIDLPLLKTVGYYCFTYNYSLTSINLPLLQKSESNCFNDNYSLTYLNLPSLQTVRDFCFTYNNSLTTIDLPLLQTAGYYCFTENNSLSTINISGQKLNYISVDCFPFIIISEKKVNDYTVYSGYNLLSIDYYYLKKEECFVASKDDYFAHGSSIKKVIEDLEFKILSKKLKKEPIEKDTMFTVNYYRALTGACDLGIRSWLKSNNIPFEVIDEGTDYETTKELTPIKAIDLMPMLEQTKPYGFNKLKSLVTW